ncbi:DUF1254 domain-containing protein [Desulfosporosinus metallidurans]|uniref:Putative exported protein n=1 Tax=Desulfosporosinus metallidurans TaxID=1888891 RepID=A0A1Q8QI47_9FIRM|nr:DUF1254 domain-containing protein [Desulfosporosinus metallidurans]OLN26948.1 putative exported protein [Desulfosporosinus metallidurans]
MSHDTEAKEERAFELGKQAYLYGCPIVIMEDTMRSLMSLKPFSYNEYIHNKRLSKPKDRQVVAPNNDTLYSSAWLDLAAEPIVMHLPHTNGRYYVMALYDMYTNNFYCVGQRVTGTNEGDYVIVGPQWKGSLPEELKAIKAPTNNVWIIGRILVNGVEDLPDVNALQKQFTLIPLSKFLNGDYSSSPMSENERLLNPDSDVPDELKFWEKLRVALKNNPPQEDEAGLINTFAEIGLTADISPFTKLDPAFARGLIRAEKATKESIDKSTKNQGTVINGWNVITEKIGMFGNNYELRAFAAITGLGALVLEEAYYARAFMDGEGKTLNGKNKYILHFDKIPPTEAFWSISLYDKEYFFVENEINRYAFGDRTENIRYNLDGSLDIYIQNERPKGKESNWLPAPKDDFNVILRFYIPKPEVSNGEYQIPPLKIIY